MSDEKKPAKTREKTPGVKVPRVRKPGDIRQLRLRHWTAIVVAWRLMKAEGATYAEQLSAIHALNQASGAYVKLLEQTDLKNELEKLRAELAELRQSEGLRKVV